MTANNKKKLVKTIRLTAVTAWWCVLALLVALLVNIFGAKLLGRVPSVFGYSIMNIISGSMEDEIPKGSYILIKKQDAEEVEIGDIICFYSSDPLIYGMPNTHRVVDIIEGEQIEFVTRGDANLREDKVTAKGENLIGVYVKRLDGLTAFSDFLKGNLLICVMIVLQICTISMFSYAIVTAKKNKSKGDKAVGEADQSSQE